MFRYLPLSKKLIVPVGGHFSGFAVYKITLDTIEASYNIRHASSYDLTEGCPFMPARSLVVQSTLTTFWSQSVISTDLNTGRELWNLTLQGPAACHPDP